MEAARESGPPSGRTGPETGWSRLCRPQVQPARLPKLDPKLSSSAELSGKETGHC